MKKLVAVTSCPTGIAHTYMAAEALSKAAAELGYEIKVETRGSVGVENALSAEEIAAADAVIIAANAGVDDAPFAGKRLVRTDAGTAIKGPKEVIAQALAAPLPEAARPDAYAQEVAKGKEERSAQRTGPYKHLMNGVSFLIPLVTAGGLLIALSFAFGIEAFKEQGTLAAALMDIGGGAAFALMIPILAGYIAFSIADRPGLTPGLIGGMLAAKTGSGFLGGIVAGFLAGYVARWLRDNIRLSRNLEGLKPVLILPVLSTLVVGLTMVYIVGEPVKAVMDALTETLKAMTSSNAAVLGLLLGAMMAFDMGGPVNKAAYTFGVGLLGSQIYEPMAAVMAAGMTPPLGLALATYLAKNRFSPDEREAGKAAAVLGLSFITEGAIPFAASDPLRVIPALVAGSAVTGGLSMLFGCTLRAPHGGIFVLPIPNAVGNVAFYVLAIAAGTLVTALLVSLLKKRVS